MSAPQMLWRQLDTPGHDACRLWENEHGWHVEGTAVFLHDGAPAWLGYVVSCDRSWKAQRGQVSGWLGARAVEFVITRTPAGVWALDGADLPALNHCIDLDFGFTPATNLFPIRRLALADGQAADAPAAWLDVAAGTLTALPQRYERRSETMFYYQSPRYEALLEITPLGFVRRYPGCWDAES